MQEERINYNVIADTALDLSETEEFIAKVNEVCKQLVSKDIDRITLSIKYQDKDAYNKAIAAIDTDPDMDSWTKITKKAVAYDKSIVEVKQTTDFHTSVKVLEVIKAAGERDINYYKNKLKHAYNKV